MHPVIARTAALATTLAAVLFVAAPPASAAVNRRSGDACTHNWNGPQVCIAIDGHGNWASRLTVTWTNPGRAKQSTALLHEGDGQTEVHVRMTGKEQGGQIVAEWTDIQLAWGKVCGSFTDTPGVWACMEVHTSGPYSA